MKDLIVTKLKMNRYTADGLSALIQDTLSIVKLDLKQTYDK